MLKKGLTKPQKQNVSLLLNINPWINMLYTIENIFELHNFPCVTIIIAKLQQSVDSITV